MLKRSSKRIHDEVIKTEETKKNIQTGCENDLPFTEHFSENTTDNNGLPNNEYQAENDNIKKRKLETLSDEIKSILHEGFKNIVDTKNDFLIIYKDRLNLMQTSISSAGFNYEQALTSDELYSIWESTQSFKDFDKYIIDVTKKKQKRSTETNKSTKNYM